MKLDISAVCGASHETSLHLLNIPSVPNAIAFRGTFRDDCEVWDDD